MKSELAVATLLMKQIDWNGKVQTFDALYCQCCLCHALRLAGGEYLFLVKGNQPQLLEDSRVFCAPLEPATRAGEGLFHLPSNTALDSGERAWADGPAPDPGVVRTHRLL